MRVVLQRVSRARVLVDGQVVGEVSGEGLVAFVGVTPGDGAGEVALLARKIAELRVLRDERSVLDAGAGVLVVSQFTLYADTRKGRRPTWSAAAPRPVAEPVVDALVEALRERGVVVATGVFGADMAVELTNDGPVTILLEA
ncbi:D-tyrosyl-tRNA(Tyr) deacylase [Beutenbergia cavernae DSM 12333]|uniref:D-aminoacyl-tRNA deacylase n=1 Tax=Beutenbergia cavernae (strain ATCC BAA-8 / DSM 12333 / CCUG 43141 / JCM 11478 / NBRC 16432 / NCIMB 13614 / HKI 0122) TaxID=471853 RepID=DTD_BEUC1|nr:D-aminoacyl-tRNA deacylase [Beutenbergia cavernae]C5C226.1 RecName: Full=D-aminoacyl-tRNA deacylase; Short=DTD; AltName: Full=Gly-tRNA(Ala) deacylase [Beutenbergia cavernae DSM 12333]ACQ81651.1 D-tyrosyl-tRNA(Tyr) deacylase [Beutenbergia cavernae DSM 12333]